MKEINSLSETIFKKFKEEWSSEHYDYWFFLRSVFDYLLNSWWSNSDIFPTIFICCNIKNFIDLTLKTLRKTRYETSEFHLYMKKVLAIVNTKRIGNIMIELLSNNQKNQTYYIKTLSIFFYLSNTLLDCETQRVYFPELILDHKLS